MAKLSAHGHITSGTHTDGDGAASTPLVVARRPDGRALICETVHWPGNRESYRITNGRDRLSLTPAEGARLASVLFSLCGRE